MHKPIRILQVCATLDRGGAETMIMNLYRNIDREKIQFDFVVNERETAYVFEKEVKLLGGNIYTIPKYKGYNFLEYKQSWNNLFQSHPEWQVLHAHNTSPAFIYMEIAKKFNITTISHSHTAGTEKSIKSFLKKVTRFPLRYRSDYLIACSLDAAKWMFGTKSHETTILYNAIETEKFIINKELRECVRAEFGLKNNTVVGHIGRFDEVKNHTFIIEVFKEYNNLNSNSILLLVGEGSLRLNIEALVEKYSLKEKVFFLGLRDDVNRILQGIDIFLFPSLYEGLPVTLIEAQAAGIPIVASDSITTEVMVTDLINYKSLKDSPISWAKTLNQIDYTNRESTYEKIKMSGYDVKDTADQLQDYYRSIIIKSE